MVKGTGFYTNSPVLTRLILVASGKASRDSTGLYLAKDDLAPGTLKT